TRRHPAGVRSVEVADACNAAGRLVAREISRASGVVAAVRSPAQIYRLGVVQTARDGGIATDSKRSLTSRGTRRDVVGDPARVGRLAVGGELPFVAGDTHRVDVSGSTGVERVSLVVDRVGVHGSRGVLEGKRLRATLHRGNES